MSDRMFAAEVRVRYADTDAMGIAYHANYLVWFEVGRTELMRASGVEYAKIEADGVMLPVVEAEIHWRQPARYDDLLVVETTLAGLSPAKIRFAYRVVRKADGQLLCEGSTLHGFVTREGRPVALPRRAPALYRRLSELVEPPAPAER